LDEKRPTRAIKELRHVDATSTERRLFAHVDFRTLARFSGVIPRFEIDGVAHLHSGSALLSAQILLDGFNGNVAHIPARRKSESSASEMDAMSFPQLSSEKRPQV
jgi:hypothetical protein